MSKKDETLALVLGPRWDDDAQAAFEAFVKRTRTQRDGHLLRKAVALETTRDPACLRGAIALRYRALEAMKRRDKHAKLFTFVYAAAVHRRLDEDEIAERLLRDAMALVPLGARMIEAEQQPERMLAHLLEHAGRTEESDDAWASYTSYLATLQFPIVPRKLEAIARDAGVTGIDGSPYRGLDDAAEHFVVNHHVRRGLRSLFDADRAALVALDADARLEPLVGPQPGEARRAVPELGAYLARCTVRSAGASYDDGPHLTASRITIRGETRDPFAAAFRVIERGASIPRVFDALIA
jgi:hypothetical protein